MKALFFDDLMDALYPIRGLDVAGGYDLIYGTRVGYSREPKRNGGQLAHQRWKRARASGRR